MHVAAEHDVWLVLSDPLRKLGVAEITGAAPADRRLVRRRVMDPDPLLARLPRGLGELRRDAVARDRPIPPGADGEQRVVDHERLAVGGDAFGLSSAEPFGDLLAGLVRRIEIVVAGAGPKPGARAQAADIFTHHHA